MSQYVRTFAVEGDTCTHLVWPGRDNTICGTDIAGDDTIHRKPPEIVKGRRITCPHCQQLIAAVKDHLKIP